VNRNTNGEYAVISRISIIDSSTPTKVALAQSLYENKNNTIEEICKTPHISRATLYRYIKVK
jgi:response regulator of citrate/malate metabolism